MDLSDETLDNIAEKHMKSHHGIRKELYKQYMKENFPTATIQYAEEWAARFEQGVQFQDSDHKGTIKLLQLMLQERQGYAKHFREDQLVELLAQQAESQETLETWIERLREQFQKAQEPDLQVAEKFDSEEGIIEAELYREEDKGLIKFYKEEESEPYRTEEFDSYEKADKEFFSLDHQVINKFYL